MLLLALGYRVLDVNYRGSLGYGKKNVEFLSGKVGVTDVEDCAELLKSTLAQFGETIDNTRIGLFGGSHGGFLTAWLLGHPVYKSLFKTGILWNPSTSISLGVCTTDIVDWNFSTGLNKKVEWPVTREDHDAFFEHSPISVCGNVNVPTLFIMGEKDQRVSPFNGIYFYNVLRERGIETKMYMYPGQGHSISGIEEGVDANMNIFRWLIQYLDKCPA